MLRRLARHTHDADQVRRLLSVASIYDGGSSCTDSARLRCVTGQFVGDWELRSNNRGPDGLINGKAPVKPSLLNDERPWRKPASAD